MGSTSIVPITSTIDYTTASEVRLYLDQMTPAFDSAINLIATRVSRAIDNYTLRRFYTSTGDEVRSFNGPPWRPDPVGIGFGTGLLGYGYGSYGNAGTRRWFSPLDIVSVTTLQLANGTNDAASTAYTTIDSRDFFLEPADRRDGWPAEWLELSDSPVGTYSTAAYMWFSPGQLTIKVTGRFGWPSTGSSGVPDDIREVAVEEAVRWFQARSVGFGDMAGVAEITGAVPYSKFLSARSRMILDSYRRPPLP